MLKQRYSDSSHSELYQNGDLVEIIVDDKYSTLFPYESGEWGVVRLSSQEDKQLGRSSLTSHVRVFIAGYSSPVESFIQSYKVGVSNLKSVGGINVNGVHIS